MVSSYTGTEPRDDGSPLISLGTLPVTVEVVPRPTKTSFQRQKGLPPVTESPPVTSPGGWSAPTSTLEDGTAWSGPPGLEEGLLPDPTTTGADGCYPEGRKPKSKLIRAVCKMTLVFERLVDEIFKIVKSTSVVEG